MPSTVTFATSARRAPPRRRATHYNAGNYDKAIAEYSAAIARSPQTARYYDYRGRAYEAQNKLDRALADYSDAIGLIPKTPRSSRGVLACSTSAGNGAERSRTPVRR